MSYEAVVKEDSPKGYWRLGEASGASAADASGNVQTGTYKNAPTLGVAGALAGDADTAVTFNGTNQWISVPDSAIMDLGSSATYEFWAKRGTISTAQTVLDKGAGHLITRFLAATNKLLVRRNGVANICESTIAITDTNWHHYVITVTPTTAKVWIDGVDRTGAVTSTTLVNTAVILSIGASEAGAEEFFNGSLDEAAVYGTALSQARVEAHFAAAQAVAGNPLAMVV